MQDHLCECETCAREFAAVRLIVRLTTTIPQEDVPASLHQAIMMRLAYADSAPSARRQAAPQRLMMLNPWMWTAVTGATAALVVGLLRPQPAAQTPQPRAAHSPEQGAPPSEPPAESEPAPRVAAVPAPAADPAVAAPLPAAPPATGVAELAPLTAPVRARAERGPVRPQPVPLTPAGPAAAEPRLLEPAAPTGSMPGSMLAAMPGDPVINSIAAMPGPELGMMLEKDPVLTATGPMEMVLPGDENEGEQALRMFLEERNRTAPQPTLYGPRDRRMRKL